MELLKEEKKIMSNTNNISRKIVAIGGGENGRIKSDGTRLPYELEIQDKEIIRLYAIWTKIE